MTFDPDNDGVKWVEVDYLLPGDRTPDLYWTWADGDAFTPVTGRNPSEPNPQCTVNDDLREALAALEHEQWASNDFCRVPGLRKLLSPEGNHHLGGRGLWQPSPEDAAAVLGWCAEVWRHVRMGLDPYTLEGPG